jgi:uncharacterized membrane protein YphA (DoxX/SURF4 family)
MESPVFSKFQNPVRIILTMIRILIGWHFLYEGIVKFFTPDWSAGAYLLESTWWFSGIFKTLATNQSLLPIVNFLNTWGLILIGLGLFSGLFTRISAWAGAGLLLLYYLSHPPFIGLMEGNNVEGSYLWVNKNLIEMFMLVLLAVVPLRWMFGADNLVRRSKKSRQEVTSANKLSPDIAEIADPVLSDTSSPDRRTVIKNLAAVPLMGGFAYAVLKKYAYENVVLDSQLQKKTDAVSSASAKFKTFAGLSELKEKVPKGKIGNLEISRLISGGNLLSGNAHSRDLKYVNGLMNQYFTEDRVFDTFRLCEACGINSVLVRTDTRTVQLIHRYWKLGGKIQWLAQAKTIQADKDFTINAQIAMDNGASAIYIQGDNTDEWVYEGRFDLFDQWFARFQGKGIPLGVGAHELDVVKAMEERGYPVDFYMKTIHDHNYWSYQPDEPKVRVVRNKIDNYWCREPEETAQFMETVNKPWIGFKILAAGAIEPEHGFKYAFESGADFVCVGMFDFQVVEDCNILTGTLKGLTGRKRKFT